MLSSKSSNFWKRSALYLLIWILIMTRDLDCAPYSKRLVQDFKLYITRHLFVEFYSSHSIIIFSLPQLFFLHLFLRSFLADWKLTEHSLASRDRSLEPCSSVGVISLHVHYMHLYRTCWKFGSRVWTIASYFGYILNLQDNFATNNFPSNQSPSILFIWKITLGQKKNGLD